MMDRKTYGSAVTLATDGTTFSVQASRVFPREILFATFVREDLAKSKLKSLSFALQHFLCSFIMYMLYFCYFFLSLSSRSVLTDDPRARLRN